MRCYVGAVGAVGADGADGYCRLRARVKDCAKCHQFRDVLFRCRYADFDWLFLCQTCLLPVKNEHELTYTYGGTWKSKKK
jgi:hypothetical protein